MTTLDNNPGVLQFLLWKATNAAAQRRDRRRTAATALTGIQAIIRLVLTVAGFSLLTWAGFSWNMTAGLVVAGLSCFILAWLTVPDTNTAHSPQQTRR